MNSREHFTIIGGAGFIGSELGAYLSAQGASCGVPDRDIPSQLEGPLGHVLYCAGTTADFRQRPFDTIEAHISQLNRILRDGRFDSLTYLSSTRVYIHSETTNENARISVDPNNPEDLFNLSKLSGESLCINSGRRNVRAIRVSNVIGEDPDAKNFVFDLMRAAKVDGRIVLRSSLASEKDYIHIADVVAATAMIARGGTRPLYNLASGTNVTNQQMVEQILLEIPAELEIVANAPTIRFRPIDIGRIVGEFGLTPRPVLAYVRRLAAKFQASTGL